MDDQTGASSVEYALLLTGIAAAVIAIVIVLGTEVLRLFQSVEGGF